MKNRLFRFIGLLIGLTLLGAITIFAYGVYRYGSVAALMNRVRVEVAGLQPSEPVVVATFVPEQQVSADEFTAALELEPTQPLPTPVVVIETVEAAEEVEPAAATETATPEPTLTPTALPTATPIPIYAPQLDFVNLTGYQHNWQTWNNCGPATIATYLSFHGKTVTQVDTAAVLKPNERDKNVRVDEIVSFVESRFPDLEVTPLMNGSAEELKLLLSNNLPVMLQTWLEEDPDDGMGHYRFLVGYDQATNEWIVSDSYVSTGVESPYAGIRVENQKFLDHWLVFDNIFILIYEPDEAELVRSIVGDDLDPDQNLEQALVDYAAKLQADDQNPFLWHTMGDLLLQDGRPEQAAQAYDQARAIGLPWRMFWYSFGVFEAYSLAGRHQDVLDLADATIESGGPGEEIYLWKGLAHQALGDEAAAQDAYNKGLWWNPTYQPILEVSKG